MFDKKSFCSLFLILAVFFAKEPPFANAQTLDQIDTQIEQSKGVYQPMNLDYMGYSIGMTQKAWQDPLKNMGEGQTKPAYSRYIWSNGTILPIRIRQSMVTLINFPEWEYIEDAWVGDSGSFSAQQIASNKMLLMPAPGMPAGVDSNVVLIGRSGNRYVFYVRSEGINTERLTHLVVDIEISENDNPSNGTQKVMGGSTSRASFSSNNKKDGGKPETPKGDNWWDDVPLDPEKLKFDIETYVINPEDVDIAPERVWRDDIFTYIDLGPKVLNMVQRPVVSLLVQKSEVPVGFRTRGKYGRLIVVEAVGDMVLRNGAKIVCLKLRKDPAFGLDMVEYDNSSISAWGLPESGTSAMQNNVNAGGQQLSPINNQPLPMENIEPNSMNNPAFFENDATSEALQKRNNISVEIASDSRVENLERLWEEISSSNADIIEGYEPFFSVDTSAEGKNNETFYLRVGPIKTLNEGDTLCSNLARRGVSCNVVRTQ